MRRRGNDIHATSVLAGMAAGLLGGLAGAWVMTKVPSTVTRAPEALRGERRQSQDGEASPASEVADAVSTQLFGHRLTEEERPTAESLVHYTTGAGLGAVYGAMAALAPGVARGRGLPFGAAVWLGLDEITLAALGLAEPPTHYPASRHAMGLVNHLAYGVTVDTVWRVVRRAADRATR